MSLKKSARYYRYTNLSLLTGMALILGMPAAQAGFEWVQTSKTPEAKNQAEAPAQIQEPADGPLVPGPEMAPPLEMEPAPATPVPVPRADMLPMPAAEPPPASVPVEQPVPLLPPVAEPPVIKTKVITPEVPENLPPAPNSLMQTDRQHPVAAPVPVLSENKNEAMPSGETLLGTGSLSTPSQPAAVVRSPINPMPVPVQTQSAAYSTVDGFGEDVPLALALSQVVPPAYGYSFAADVNPGLRVSWNGGKPWNQVVSDMIAPLGLHVRITGSAVHIYGREQQPTPMPQKQTMEDIPDSIAPVAPMTPPPTAAAEPLQLAKPATNVKHRTIRDPGEFTKADQALGPHMMQHEEYTPIAPARTAYPGERASEKEIVNLMPRPASTLPKASDFMNAAPAPAGKTGAMAIWEATQGESLRATLLKWTARADVELVWNAAHDYTVDSSLMVSDTFQNALKTMLTEGLRQSRPAVRLFNPPPERGSARTVLIVEDNPQNAG